MNSPGSPEESAKMLKRLAGLVFPGYTAYVINPEGPRQKSPFRSDYCVPADWLQNMTEILGPASLVDPERIPGGGSVFDRPMIWVSLNNGGGPVSALVILSVDPGVAPGPAEVDTARELSALFEMVASARLQSVRLKKEMRRKMQKLQEEAGVRNAMVKKLDRDVRDPLNTVIGYSVLLLEGAVSGRLTETQEGFVRDILDGGYQVLKEFEMFVDKILSPGDKEQL